LSTETIAQTVLFPHLFDRPLVAAFDQEHERAQRAIAALEKIGGTLQQDVQRGAREAVNAALSDLRAQTERAAGVLGSFTMESWARMFLQSIGVALITLFFVMLLVWIYLPSRQEMSELRQERETLQAGIANLEKRGARIQLSQCGNPGDKQRLCVAVDRAMRTYRDPSGGDVYMITKGY